MESLSDAIIDAALDELIGKISTKWVDASPLDRTDVHEFDVLEAKAAQLSSLSDVVQRRLHTRLALIMRRRNCLLPLHRLPAEIFASIFSYVVEEFPEEEQHRHYIVLQALSSVCHRWRSIVWATPSLWSVICAEAPIETVEGALARSKNTLLTVSGLTKRGDQTGADFTSLVYDHIGRWRNVFLVFRDVATAVESGGLGHPAPNCEHVHIRILSNECNGHLDLFGGKAERLKSLTACGCPLPWNSAVLRGLRSLILGDLTQRGPTLREMLTIIQASPQLENIAFDDITFSDEELGWDEFRQIDLPKLARLKLKGQSMESTQAILTRLSFPNCISLGLECCLDGRAASAFLNPSLNHLRSVITDAALRAGTLYLKIGAGCLHFAHKKYFDASQGEGFDIHLYNTNPLEVFAWLLHALPPRLSIRDTKVEIEEEEVITDMTSDELFMALMQLPAVSSLLLDTKDDATGLLRRLATPVHIPTPQGAPPATEWPLPNLSRIDFMSTELDPDALVDMVERRYGAQPMMNGFASAPLPKKFCRLLIIGVPGMSDGHYDRLCELVGDDVIEWDP